MKVGVVIPYFNGENYIEKCLDSIFKTDTYEVYAILIDNSSVPQKKLSQVISKYQKNIFYYKTEPKIGFSRAVNIGAKLALKQGVGVIIILNQDTILMDNCIDRLVSTLISEESLAAVGPMQYIDYELNIESFFIKYYLSQNPDIFKDLLKNRIKSFYPLDTISGTCLAVLSETIEQYGLFDESYFMYYEDDDLCRKYKCLGFKVGINPQAGIIHYHQHVNAPKDQKIWINRYKISSRFVYELKDIKKSFISCLLSYLSDNLYDYLKDLFKLKIGAILIHLYYDLRNIMRLPRVLISRKKERRLCSGKHLPMWDHTRN